MTPTTLSELLDRVPADPQNAPASHRESAPPGPGAGQGPSGGLTALGSAAGSRDVRHEGDAPRCAAYHEDQPQNAQEGAPPYHTDRDRQPREGAIGPPGLQEAPKRPRGRPRGQGFRPRELHLGVRPGEPQPERPRGQGVRPREPQLGVLPGEPQLCPRGPKFKFSLRA